MAMTLAELNQKQENFWKETLEKVEPIGSGRPPVFARAAEDYQTECWKPGVATTFEKIVLDLDEAFIRLLPLYQKCFSWKGVQARKPDELGELIEEIVSQRPGITCQELESIWRFINTCEHFAFRFEPIFANQTAVPARCIKCYSPDVTCHYRHLPRDDPYRTHFFHLLATAGSAGGVAARSKR